jgi:bifunctional non-homologous end joining protein LigD
MPKKQTIFAGLSEQELKLRKKITEPLFIDPMLATLTNEYFSKTTWIYEQKFDGERCIAIKKKGKVYLVSRNRKSMNAQYPELVRALERQTADNFIIDGEIIAAGATGVSDFQLLQGRINLNKLAKIESHAKHIPISFCIFDIMFAESYDLRHLPLLARKKILKKLLQTGLSAALGRINRQTCRESVYRGSLSQLVKI